MSFTPFSGTAGSVKLHGGSGIAGIQSWKILGKTGEVPIPHFELTANADGAVYSTFLKGLSDATVQIAAVYDTATQTFANGKSVTLDLLFDKTGPFGYLNVPGFVTAYEPGTDVNNQAGMFTCTVRMTGAIPTPGAS